jgi:AraC-like DNA-binding protein
VLGQQLLRLGQPGGRLPGPQATADAAMLLALLALVAWRALRLDADGPWVLHPEDAVATPSVDEGIAPMAVDRRVAVERPGRPTAIDPAASRRPAAQADDHLLAALEQLMATQHAYRDEGLGIATLAARLGAPEYRLRRLINGRLGHRNFNAYLNGLRLAEARSALADPARRGLPVLSIALGAGFQSIGPFNRAFKADTGLTPTEFRRQKLAES